MNSVLHPIIITSQKEHLFRWTYKYPVVSMRDFFPPNLFNIIKNFKFPWSHYLTSLFNFQYGIFLFSCKERYGLSKRMDELIYHNV
jgi:hypothetical protein